MAAPSKDMICRIAYGDIYVQLVAENASWSPDVADDLIKRMSILWADTVKTIVESGIIEIELAEESEE